ncbi:hypothetical protein [Paenibacillus sp. ACRRY]|uniref:hypothetical protein n=1 Tax=Paenibacillus sp. ACRRY TaxID=2918208 RepID=UPI0031BB562C
MIKPNGDIQAVFMDRDGTIGGTGHFIHPRDFELYTKAQEAIALLKRNGIKVFAITNQYRISRGEATIQEFEEHFSEYGSINPIYAHMNKNAAAENPNRACCWRLHSSTI